MTDDSETTTACCWMATLLDSAWPATAGVTLSAIAGLAGQETFSGLQVAYLMQLAMLVGAEARSAGDRAELAASQEARFEPRPTRDARIAARIAAMEVAHEIRFLRQYGRPPDEWAGGTAEEALRRFGWDADRPEIEVPNISTKVRRGHGGQFVWASA